MKRRKFIGWMASSLGAVLGLSSQSRISGAAVTQGSQSSEIDDHPMASSALSWPQIAHESAVPVGHSVQFTYGAGSKWAGKNGALYRESASKFTAFDLICTHMGCTAVPVGAAAHCPCHHSSFSLLTGAATAGPAQQFHTGSLSASEIAVTNGIVRWVRDL